MVRSSLKLTIAMSMLTGSLAFAQGAKPVEDVKPRDENSGKVDRDGRPVNSRGVPKTAGEIRREEAVKAETAAKERSGRSGEEASKSFSAARTEQRNAVRNALTPKQLEAIRNVRLENGKNIAEACSTGACDVSLRVSVSELNAKDPEAAQKGIHEFRQLIVGKSKAAITRLSKMLAKVLGYEARTGVKIAETATMAQYMESERASINEGLILDIIVELMDAKGTKDPRTVLREAFLEFGKRVGMDVATREKFAEDMLREGC